MNLFEKAYRDEFHVINRRLYSHSYTVSAQVPIGDQDRGLARGLGQKAIASFIDFM